MSVSLRRAYTAIATMAVATMAGSGLFLAGTPAQAAFTSTIGGTITRTEVIERAQYWVDHQPGPYDQSGYSPDPTGSRSYRRDCSGYVDMAWHTSTDNWTGNLADISYGISRSELIAGDILNDAAEHVILFDAWEADRVHFSYYSFGSTPVHKVTHASINQATFDSHPNADYVARRYNKIDSSAPAVAATRAFGSVVEQHYFDRGPDGHLHHWYWSQATGYGYQDWGGELAGVPAAFVDAGGQQVFGRGSDGHLHHWYWSPATGNGYQDWAGELAGVPTGFADGASQHVFGRGSDGHLHHWYWSAGTGNGYQDWGGDLTGDPAGFVDGSGEQVFGRGSDGHLHHWYWSAGTGNGYQDWGGQLTMTPIAFSDGGSQHVFGRGSDGHLHHWYWSPATGNGYQDWAGDLTTTPAGFATNDGSGQHVFGRGSDGHLHHWYWSPATGNGYQDWGGQIS